MIDEFMKLYNNENNLNTKVARSCFDDVLDMIGHTLQEYARKVAANEAAFPEIHHALNANPVPAIAKEIMTKEFRIFCLALNALKQWLSAEQSSTDRVLLGGKFRQKVSDTILNCVVTNESIVAQKKGTVNFHHPMRDGRFPIPLSKHGHDLIEKQISTKKEE